MDYQKSLPSDFARESRVWIYQSNRPFSAEESQQVEKILHEFVATWHSHGEPVKGFGALFFSHFIILMADETGAGVSGCSTDSSVHVIKEIERMLQVRLFDRVMLAFLIDDQIKLLPLSRLPYALKNGQINEHTLYFNNTVHTKAELESKWIIPLNKSWLARKLFSAGVAQLVERQLPKL